jgi:hypothetical protein
MSDDQMYGDDDERAEAQAAATGVTVEDTEDGGAIVRLENEEQSARATKHFENIVEAVDQDLLDDVVNDLLKAIEEDKKARKKRDDLYEEGLRRTGMGDDAPGGAQFNGANKVVHPMLVEACVDFSARVMKEVFPPAGPVKSKILGRVEREKLEKARRKSEFMNWQCTEQMPEFRGELEQLSTQLPLGGGQYLKGRFDRRLRRPVFEFVPIDDMLIPFAATNFYSAERRTHVLYVTAEKYNARVRDGDYIEIPLAAPQKLEFSSASTANDKIEGRQQPAENDDGLRTLFEVDTCFDVGEGYGPYLLTIDKESSLPVALYRNWDPEDEDLRQRLEWVVEFPFVPWRGAYPIGLTHMIGGLSGATTGALRALLDSAHLQNLPTLLKLKGGPTGQTLNLQPTEVCELEGSALVDDIRKLAMPLPFSGPSPTLFQLLGFLVDAGKGVVQTSFEKLSDANPNQPVGTTMALIEQGMVVFSSIHSRIHASMARVLKILHRINSAYMTEDDFKACRCGLEVRPKDFDGDMDVIPVSDPNIFSETQRFAQTQAVLQRAAALPQLYDMRNVEEMFLRNMKVPADEVLQPKPGSEDLDPVSENVAAAMGRPIYVLPSQDHLAHLQAHLSFLKSPVFGSNPAIVKQYLWPMAQHLRDHLLNYYLVESHDAVDKAQAQQMIPEDDAQQQLAVIVRVQQAIEQQLGTFAQELAAIDQAAQQFKPQPPMPPDNSMQVAQLRASVDQQKLAAQQQFNQQRLAVDQQQQAIGQQLEQQKLADKQQDREARLTEAQLRESAEDRRTVEEMNSRERMNSSDNETAMLLAAAEMATGEKVAVSTGTGINPNP